MSVTDAIGFIFIGAAGMYVVKQIIGCRSAERNIKEYVIKTPVECDLLECIHNSGRNECKKFGKLRIEKTKCISIDQGREDGNYNS
jgi:hypothetical protein